MKTVINHAAAESFEVVKRALYSFQVLIVGVLIPLLFIVGINTNLGDTMSKETTIGKPHQEIAPKDAVGIVRFLSDKNS
mgnify:CR=1 FL=1